VLDALRAQTIPLQQWEFLFIDNASKERLADTWDVSWHPRGRHLREDEIGLTAARLRGIRDSRGELLVFVDDDNLLSPDFLEQAERISARYPYLGVFGAGILEAANSRCDATGPCCGPRTGPLTLSLKTA